MVPLLLRALLGACRLPSILLNPEIHCSVHNGLTFSPRPLPLHPLVFANYKHTTGRSDTLRLARHLEGFLPL